MSESLVGPTVGVMLDRHVPLLCGSCRAPIGRQEEICWRCGAMVRCGHGSPRSAYRRQRPPRGSHRIHHVVATLSPRRSRPTAAAGTAGPTRAEDCARWQRERTEAHALTVHSTRDLATTIAVGEAGYRRLRQRLDDFGTRLAAVDHALGDHGDGTASAVDHVLRDAAH
jgi:hypothetical protein